MLLRSSQNIILLSNLGLICHGQLKISPLGVPMLITLLLVWTECILKIFLWVHQQCLKFHLKLFYNVKSSPLIKFFNLIFYVEKKITWSQVGWIRWMRNNCHEGFHQKLLHGISVMISNIRYMASYCCVEGPSHLCAIYIYFLLISSLNNLRTAQ